MAIYRFRSFVLTGGSDAKEVVAAAVGAGFFEVVQVPPALGRAFLPEEDAPGRGRVVILSDGFWKRHFGGAPDVVGRTLRLDGEAYTVVGVMPARFSVRSVGRDQHGVVGAGRLHRRAARRSREPQRPGRSLASALE